MTDTGSLVLTLTDQNFSSHIEDQNTPILVDFWASWCAPCKAIAPHLEDIAKKYEGKVRVGKLNVDEQPSTASAMGIRALPTLLLFKNGQVVEQIVGAVGKDRLEQAINSSL